MTVTGLNPDEGPLAGGTSVTITGSGFTGATGVSFGSTAADELHGQLGRLDHRRRPRW